MEIIFYYTISRINNKIVVDAFSDLGNYNYNNYNNLESLKDDIKHDFKKSKYKKIRFQRIYKKDIILN